jgi:hypothetical protein
MTERPEALDNIVIRVYDSNTAPTYDATRAAAPKREYQTHNTTRDLYHEEIVNALDGVSPDLTVDVLVLGDSTDDTANIPTGDPLGNELFRTSVTDTFTDGQTFSASIFLDSTEANALNLTEAALVAEQSGGVDLPLNRFLLDDPSGLLDPKSQNETVTIDINITQEDA